MSDASDPEARPGADARYPPPAVSRGALRRLSVVWLIPVVALLVGAALVARAVLQRGPDITISFRSAEGLEAGRTEVRYKEVVVGRVGRVRLSDDRSRVLVDVGLDKSADKLAVEDTRFWVVRPRIGTGGVSGLGTLLSGAYIGVDAGVSTESKTDFAGLEAPPFVLRGEPGRSFVLTAEALGALDVGSLVYYRGTRVGRVVGYSLDNPNNTLDLSVFIESPNEHLVTTATRFWNASGVDLSLSASGVTLNTQSLVSVLVGGVAFANPEGQPAPQAPEGARFDLYPNQKAALAPPDGKPLRVRMQFGQSLRGLAAGAPIDLLGVEVGTVRSVVVHYDPTSRDDARRFPIEVAADLYLARLGPLRQQFATEPGAPPPSDAAFLKRLVDNGFRAQVRTGNLLTGQLYIAFDHMPKEPGTTLDAGAGTLTVPTVPGALSEVQAQVAEIVQRLRKVRFDEIGDGLQQTLKGAAATAGALQRTLNQANEAIAALSPEAQRTLAEVRRTLESAQATLGALQGTAQGLERNVLQPESTLLRETGRTLAELQRAAAALRTLADYLQQHPESLLRGKPPDPDLSRGGARREEAR